MSYCSILQTSRGELNYQKIPFKSGIVLLFTDNFYNEIFKCLWTCLEHHGNSRISFWQKVVVIYCFSTASLFYGSEPIFCIILWAIYMYWLWKSSTIIIILLFDFVKSAEKKYLSLRLWRRHWNWPKPLTWGQMTRRIYRVCIVCLCLITFNWVYRK